MKAMLLRLADRIDADREASLQHARLIFDSPSLSARTHFEFSKWEPDFIKAIKRGRKVSIREHRKLEIQVAVVVTAFVVAVRQWAYAGNSSNVKPWISAAFDAV
jgi:hypothetical protein